MKKSIFFILSVIALFSLIIGITGCSKKKSTQPPPPPKPKWTIMCYIDGNNNLDGQGSPGTSWSVYDIQLMEKVGSTNKVRIVAEVGRAAESGTVKRYLIEHYPDDVGNQISSTELENLGGVDMSDENTLEDFIDWAKSKYPAEHYMLLVQDHGAGWHGTCVDDFKGGGNLMTLTQFKDAVTGKDLDIIAFDACLMSMVEVIYELREATDYIVASQNPTLAATFGYTEFLDSLTTNPSLAPYELCKVICDASWELCHEQHIPGCIATSDMGKVTDLATTIDDFARKLNLSSQVNAIVTARYNARVQADQPDFVDLYNFATILHNLVPPEDQLYDACINTKNAITNVASYTRPNETQALNGLCIYFPDKFSSNLRYDDLDYKAVSFHENTWSTFLSYYDQLQSGGTLVINSNPSGAEVFLDGQDLEHTTPLTIENVPEGDHTVKLTLTGYQDWQQTVHITAGQTTEINATLTPQGTDTGVSGTVTYGGQPIPANTYACFVHGDTLYYNPDNTVSANGTYSIIDMYPGQYLIAAWNDKNGNIDIDTGDLFGMYPDLDNPQEVPVTSGQITPNINFSISQITGKSSIKVLRQTK